MTTKNIIRAWKDSEYRNNLTDSERASLPAHPAGCIELSDVDLDDVAGGARPWPSTIQVFCSVFVNCYSHKIRSRSKPKGEKTMTTKNIIRAWKDADYRNSLTDSERASMPAHPAGCIELTDVDLDDVAGGFPIRTFADCTTIWQTLATKCPKPF